MNDRPLVRFASGMIATLIVAASQALAHDQIPGGPQIRPILIENATLHVVDGPLIPRGSVLFEDGKLTRIGDVADPPDNVQRIDGTGRHIYPGLFESMTDLGLREIDAVGETLDDQEHGRSNPNVRSWVAINPDSELIPVTRAGGVLLAHVAPRGNYLAGQSAVVNLDGWGVDDMLLSAPTGMIIDWQSLQPREGESAERRKQRESRLQELDDLLDAVGRYAAARSAEPTSAGDRNKSLHQKPIATDVRLESLVPVVDGRLPLIAWAETRGAIESAIAYCQSRSLRLIIYGGYDAEASAELLKRYDVPIIVAGVYRTPRRRDDPYDFPASLPRRLADAGVRFAIAGEGPSYPGRTSNARNLPYHAGHAIAFGLDPAQALRAITLAPAEILGVADRVGSLTVGKDATLIITDGDIFDIATHVQHAFINGRTVDLGNRHETLFRKYQEKYRP